MKEDLPGIRGSWGQAVSSLAVFCLLVLHPSMLECAPESSDAIPVRVGVFHNYPIIYEEDGGPTGFHMELTHRIQPTPIVFNPTPVLFGMPKGRNRHILEAIDRRIAQWKSETASVYHKLSADFLTGPDRRKAAGSGREVYVILGVGLLFVLLGVLLGGFLSRNVRRTRISMPYVRHVVLFSIGITGCVWVMDAVIDRFIFYSDSRLSFIELLLTDIPPHETYIRSTFGLLCLVYAYFFARYVKRFRDAETALRESEWQMGLILNCVGEAVYGIDTGGRCTFCNPAFLKIMGYDHEDDVIGKNMHELIHHTHPDGTDYPASDCRIYRALNENIPVRSDQEVFWKGDGTSVEVEYSSSPIVSDGKLLGAVVSFSDITERRNVERDGKELQTQLQQAQKMEAVGRLTGGIAHDFNNMLSTILGYSELASMRLPEGSPVRKDLEEVVRAAERAADLTRQLLAFSRKQVIVPQIANPNTLLENLAKMMGRIIGEDIRLELRTRPDVANIKVDPTQFDQVLLNLVVNARDAMPYGGRLTIETGSVLLDEEYARHHQGVSPGPFVMIGITDTGEGMSPEVQERIFDPFFTTKGLGLGTGLGLATVYGIVKQHGGHIFVYSEIGIGSTFKIYLPEVQEEESPKSRRSRTALQQGTETVLVVDDEAAIRRLVFDSLQPLGYRVLEAASGEEALKLASSATDGIDLLLTDVIMPGMNGKDLGQRILNLTSKTKVLFMSGYTDTAIASGGILDPGVNLLHKPLVPSTLSARIREVLDGTTGMTHE